MTPGKTVTVHSQRCCRRIHGCWKQVRLQRACMHALRGAPAQNMLYCTSRTCFGRPADQPNKPIAIKARPHRPDNQMLSTCSSLKNTGVSSSRGQACTALRPQLLHKGMHDVARARARMHALSCAAQRQKNQAKLATILPSAAAATAMHVNIAVTPSS